MYLCVCRDNDVSMMYRCISNLCVDNVYMYLGMSSVYVYKFMYIYYGAERSRAFVPGFRPTTCVCATPQDARARLCAYIQSNATHTGLFETLPGFGLLCVGRDPCFCLFAHKMG